MIEIRKHGKNYKRYLTGCTECGCEFWFDNNDYSGVSGKCVGIKCPECGHTMVGQYLGDIAWVGELIVEDIK
jgi:hypothetical protein